MRVFLRSATVLVAGVALAAIAPVQSVAAAGARIPTVLHVGQIDREDIAHRPGSEAQTLVEPDVAVSPRNSQIAVAVAHDGRFATGGAIDISYAWTHDGGASWNHAPMQGLTRAAGGVWDRASDPVVAFGPSGDVYISVLVFNFGCASGVAVARSTDGGATFGTPVMAHSSRTCDYSDDKNWLVVDTQPASPHVGRIYQFWTPFLTVNGHGAGSPQVVRWSDDHGAHWSATTVVSAPHANSQNSQPMIQPDGTITDTYLVYSRTGIAMLARTSHDGGATWTPEVTVTTAVGNGPRGIRCCLPGATADPVTGELYAAWEAPGARDAVWLSSSTDGSHWSSPIRVSRDGGSAIVQHVNVAVTAFAGRVFVSYATRDLAFQNGRYVQQQVSTSYDGGATFGAPLALGPPSDLRYAAVAGGKFPGDYIGASATNGVVFLVWCVSSPPSNPSARFHQTLFAAALQP